MEEELEADEALITDTEDKTGETFLKERLVKSGRGLRKEKDLMGWEKVESMGLEFLKFLDSKEDGLEAMAMVLGKRVKKTIL